MQQLLSNLVGEVIVLCKKERTTWELKKFYTTSKFVSL